MAEEPKKGSRPSRPVPSPNVARGFTARQEYAGHALASLSWWHATSDEALKNKAEIAWKQADFMLAAEETQS
jgi:hypothetical protein